MTNLAKFRDFRVAVMNESSMARLHQHVHGRNLGIITANRGSNTADENLHANRELEGQIRKAGLGFIHVKGAYVEGKGTPQEKTHDTEHSYIVVGKKGHDSGQMKGFLAKHGELHGQESVLHKPHDSDHAQLLYTKDVASGLDGQPKKKGESEDVGAFHPRKIGEYHSRLLHKKSKAFSFANESIEIVYEFLVSIMPITFNKGREQEF